MSRFGYRMTTAIYEHVMQLADVIAEGVGPEVQLNTLKKFENAAWNRDFLDYALIVIATGHPIDRAIQYLKDTGTPVHAAGRLLLRAGERALRENGDVPETAYVGEQTASQIQQAERLVTTRPCGFCGRPADARFKCGHYVCGLCEGRQRDKCNPVEEVFDWQRGVWDRATDAS